MQEDFHRPEQPLKKTWEIDNEARISKEAKMKRKFNRNQKGITPRFYIFSMVLGLLNQLQIFLQLYLIELLVLLTGVGLLEL